jgi:N-acetylmuramoyl-L-alanine amidase
VRIRGFAPFALWWASVVLAQAASAAEVEGVRVWSGPESTRVVLDLSAPAEHRVFSLANPHRIVIDLPRSSARRALALPEPKGFVSAVRTGARPNGELRVVLDLRRSVQPKSFLLPPNEQYGHRLVIDLEPGGSDAVVRRTAAPAPQGRDLVVVIDPGHGGEDPGASGRRGVREKDVVLSIAKRLAAELERQPGIRPVLTRTGDYFVDLNRRREIANNAQADLFVSIHADAYRDASARGATVYVLSDKGASDEVARRLAARENASDSIGGVSFDDSDPVLRHVLLDLSQEYALSASTTAGDRLIDRLGTVTAMRKRQVQRAQFLVLKQPVPSVLVETAYISNPAEEAALHDSNYQAQLARALYAGILDYFQTHAPADTYLAQNPGQRVTVPIQHVIARGETLSKIAERYNVSLPSLKRSNRLQSDVILVGQVLTIPAR